MTCISPQKKEALMKSQSIGSKQTIPVITGSVLVDCREQHEWDAGHIDGARFMPLSDFANASQDLSPDTDQLLSIAVRVFVRLRQLFFYNKRVFKAASMTGGLLRLAGVNNEDWKYRTGRCYSTLFYGPSLFQPLLRSLSIDVHNAVIIDVRSPGEFAGGHVEGAINLPIDSITEADILKVAEKDQPIVLYCHSGGRAAIVQNKMTEWGFSSVRNLKTLAGVQQAFESKITTHLKTSIPLDAIVCTYGIESRRTQCFFLSHLYLQHPQIYPVESVQRKLIQLFNALEKNSMRLIVRVVIKPTELEKRIFPTSCKYTVG